MIAVANVKTGLQSPQMYYGIGKGTVQSVSDIDTDDKTERPNFYEHLGHTAETNVKAYQMPLVEKEVRLVGSHLLAMDN